MRAAIATIILAPMLASCGVDDPDNVPLRGQWEQVWTLDSVTIDGIVFAPDELPGSFRNFEGSESRCGEPVFTDRNWQREDVERRTGGQCTLDSYEHDASGAQFEGRCTLEGDGVTYNPVIRGHTRFDESSHRDVVTMEGTVVLPGDNSAHVMKAIAVQEGTRIGDC